MNIGDKFIGELEQAFGCSLAAFAYAENATSAKTPGIVGSTGAVGKRPLKSGQTSTLGNGSLGAEAAADEHSIPANHLGWWTLAQIVAELAGQKNYNVVAVSGPQGSGKSTFANYIVQALAKLPNMVSEFPAALSLDDFYLTQQQRQHLAEHTHPLLATRGVPGTHDWAAIQAVLTAVKEHAAERSSMLAGEQLTPISVPYFDKSIDDRGGVRELKMNRLVFEGWCLGVQDQPGPALQQPINQLEEQYDADLKWRTYVNQQISSHYLPLWPQMDFWIHLRVPSFEKIVEWRSQQEHAIAPALRMSIEEIRRFIEHYERLTRWQWQCPPRGPGIVVQLNNEHQIDSVQVLATH